MVRVGRKPHRIRGRHAPGERRDDPWYCFGAASLRPPIPADLRIELVDGEVSATALHRDPRDVRQLAVWTLDEAGARRLIADADRVLRLRQLLDGSVFTGSVVDGEAAAFHREPNEDDAMVQVLVRSNAADIVRLLHEVW
ncbi:MAG: hypothetical protein EP330_27855 [Deltaproteobacteria bacterium]|nr:MAG: hypothetical protein EP330_27855 [Deltaproteobacteria bacterium]